MNTTTRAALAVLAGFVVAAAANADPPPVFSDLSYEGAIAAAREQGRLLIVDGTAEWCGPCNQMDATTWVDPRVVEWLGKRAVAVQVDVDAEPDTAQALGINAMPTVIAFRDGAEIDRFVGYRAADDVLEWLNLVSEGRSMLDVLKERAVEAPGRPLREVI
ncbi:MAG: thioredoxin, partial [Planctomycetota bacterium]